MLTLDQMRRLAHHTYSNSFTVTGDEMCDAPKLDLLGAARQQMERDVSRSNAAMAGAAFPDPEFGYDLRGFLPHLSIRSAFDDLARRTSEFRKLRLTQDDWLGPGVQICEVEHVPETDTDGKPICYRAGDGGTVAIASPKVVTKMRFDAWMDRLDRLARKRSELRRRIRDLSDSGRVELWGRLQRLLNEVEHG